MKKIALPIAFLSLVLLITQRAVSYSDFVHSPPIGAKRSYVFARVIPITLAYQMIKNGWATAVDTRAIDHYRAKHIEGAIHISTALGLNPRPTLILYGYGAALGYVTEKAVSIDRSGGDVYVMSGGFQEWTDLDLPTKTVK